jgi:hypothetical protein
MIYLLYFLNILKNLENFIKIGRPGDCMNFRETPGKIGRVGILLLTVSIHGFKAFRSLLKS